MSRETRHAICPGLAALVLLAGVLVGPPIGAAQRDPQGARIRARIAAGEFAPALVEARRQAAPAQRDFWLAQIAAAQAQAGNRDASLHTAGEISDDRSRSQALSQVASEPVGGRGGGVMADFDSLIDLITTTVRPTTWDTVGGPGSIAPFPTGVYVDAQGVLQPLLKDEPSGRLERLRAASAPKASGGSVCRSSPLRMVSLPRLERHVQLALAAGRQPSDEMLLLAGLQRIKYVFVYPESGDLVLAGPAGDWAPGPENLVVSTESGQPVLRLDDLVVIFRHMTSGPDARFGCLITPRQEALARVQEFLQESNKRPIRAEGRKVWLERLRSQMGLQDIEVYGIDPRTRAARVIVEADYRMKLVGMGLEEGVPGVDSYLNLIQLAPGGSPPPMGVLRWWFTLNYDALLAAQDRRAFAVRGQGVKVLSENERLTAEGKRVHTGESEDLNRQFAQSFTTHFEALAAKYPIYAEMRNIFDLALVAALVRQEGLAEQVGWHMSCFGDPGAFVVELGAAPKTVQTVVNHRVINRVHVIAGVSGGVAVNPSSLVARQAVEIDRSGALRKQWYTAVPRQSPVEAWWWD